MSHPQRRTPRTCLALSCGAARGHWGMRRMVGTASHRVKRFVRVADTMSTALFLVQHRVLHYNLWKSRLFGAKPIRVFSAEQRRRNDAKAQTSWGMLRTPIRYVRTSLEL